MNPDDFKTVVGLTREDIYRLNSAWATQPSTTAIREVEHSYLENMMRERLEREREEQQGKLRAFRESYIKIRTNNIVLDHQSAIELTKLIYAEAATLTYEDMA